jgi:uncharacterized membrane protein YfcA
MDAADAALLLAGGLVAGVVNTLAGGGSMLTVPLLVLLGLPGGVANGSNRVGILLQSAFAAWRFRAEGVPGFREALRLFAPVLVGSMLGAAAIARVADATFERIFGVVMLAVLAATLWLPAPAPGGARRWSRGTELAVFFGIGLYGGAIQAGIGIALVLALSHAGHDLVRANSVKVVLIAALTAVALPVFVAQGQVAWAPAAVLALGFAAGGALGARLTVAGGERLIRPALVLAVAGLAGRMLGLY